MENPRSELAGKRLHDFNKPPARQRVCVEGAVIVGAGPSGLAVAACLQERGVPSLILERSKCIASLWQLKAYDRLRLHLPKQFCELPLMGFPADFPTYPAKEQFVRYLEDYCSWFQIKPRFEETVESAEYDAEEERWRVRSVGPRGDGTEFICRWVVAATGENAEAVVPSIEGKDGFEGPIVHTSMYRSGDKYEGQRVLVVGSGNSGMEVCLDLCHHKAMPSIVVRDTVHILPREMLGRSTFGLSMWLMKWLPVTVVDRLLLAVARVLLGDTAKLGLHRPKVGPIQLKILSGKTPVLDVGTLANIKSGNIKVFPGIKRLKECSVEFVDGRTENFDAIILATGYKSNVPSWLKENEMFNEEDGFPRKPFPNGWKGASGLYAVGFTKRGLMGASMDAMKIAEDIERSYWKPSEATLVNLNHQSSN